MAKDDPLEKLAKMIDERIQAAFEGRDRKAKEESDPWAKLEGIVRRAVDERFADLDAGIEEGKRREGKGGGNGDGEEKPKLGILGM